MNIFLDSSAWIKYFIFEIGTPELQKFLLEQSEGENNFFTSVVTYAEIHATIKRAHNAKRITEVQFKRIKSEFNTQWQNVDIPVVDRSLIELSGKLAEEYSLKGCDAFQLASAIEANSDLFVNSDHELTVAAQKCNLFVWDPATGEFVF